MPPNNDADGTITTLTLMVLFLLGLVVYLMVT